MKILSNLNVKQKTFLIVFGGVVPMLIILFLLYIKEELSISSGISVIGSFASTFGIALTYIQIMSVKEISSSINKAVGGAMDELFKAFSISDLSKSSRLAQEIQTLLRTGKIDSSYLRMQDLRFMLIQFKHVKVLESIYDKNEYKSINTNLNIDMSNVNSLLLKNRKGVNLQKICQNLDETVTFLSELENKLKYKRDERQD